MKKTINIGTVIDLDDLVESRMLIQANSGGGKSGIARVTMEESVGKIPFIVLERKGEYYTLKEKFPDILVIGGRNGDIPISMQAAPKLAKFIIAHRLTVVIDMSQMEGDDQRALFVRDFLKGLMNLTDDLWCQYLIFLEEAHIFCGQQEMTPSAKYVKLLMSEGRKMGFAGILLTQRIGKLHKDAAAECNNKFIGRTFLDIDINRSASEMGLVGQEKLKLRELKPQHFWAFGTSIEPHHVHEVVIKDAITKFPKAGTKINLANQKPTNKIKEALAKLNELPKEAAKELNDIKELKAEVIRLSGELKKETKPGVGSLSEKDSNLIASLRGEIELLKEQSKVAEKETAGYQRLALRFRDRLGKIKDVIEEGLNVEIPNISPKNKIVSPSVENVSRKPAFVSRNAQSISNYANNGTNIPNSVQSDASIGKCARAVITFLTQFKDRQFTKAQIGISTNYSPESGSFNNALSELNTAGFIIREGKIRVNPVAISSIIEIIGEITPQEYSIETYKNKLGKCERAIYEELLKAPEYLFTKLELGELTNYSSESGSFNNALSRLNTLELISRHAGAISLNPELLELMP
jgi:hypothetical protein